MTKPRQFTFHSGYQQLANDDKRNITINVPAGTAVDAFTPVWNTTTVSMGSKNAPIRAAYNYPRSGVGEWYPARIFVGTVSTILRVPSEGVEMEQELLFSAEVRRTGNNQLAICIASEGINNSEINASYVLRENLVLNVKISTFLQPVA